MIEKEITNTSGNKKTVKIPMVNESKCIGCGACEFVCPSRPLSAIKVNGREIHLHYDDKDNYVNNHWKMPFLAPNSTLLQNIYPKPTENVFLSTSLHSKYATSIQMP